MAPSVLYTVLTCRAYYKTRLPAVQATWARDVKDICFLGDDMGHDGDPRMLGFDVPVGYDFCGLKFYRYFLWLHTLPRTYDWYLICDDDAYVFRPRVERFLSELDPRERVCWGYYITLRHSPRHMRMRGEFRLPVSFPTGGPGMVLSRALVQAMCEYLADQEQHDPQMKRTPMSRYGDASIGLWMQKIGFRMIHDRRWVHFGPRSLGCTPRDITTALAYHYVPPALFPTLMGHDGGCPSPRERVPVRGACGAGRGR